MSEEYNEFETDLMETMASTNNTEEALPRVMYVLLSHHTPTEVAKTMCNTLIVKCEALTDSKSDAALKTVLMELARSIYLLAEGAESIMSGAKQIILPKNKTCQLKIKKPKKIVPITPNNNTQLPVVKLEDMPYMRKK